MNPSLRPVARVVLAVFFLAWGYGTTLLMAAPTAGALIAPPRAAAAQTSVAPVVRVLGSYPRACLDRVADTPGQGLLAAVMAGRVTIGQPTGTERLTLPAHLGAGQASVEWSRDGRYLATGDGRLWTSQGKSAGRLFSNLTGFWGWSSVADCALGVTGGVPGFTPNRVLSVGRPGSPSKAYLQGDIQDFAFTPDGRYVVLVVERGTTPPVTASFWRVDLRTNSVVELLRLAPETCCVHLDGFAAGGHILWFWGAPGGSVMADGWPLTGLDVMHPGTTITYGTTGQPTMTLPRSDFVTTCGGHTLAVVGLFRVASTVTDKRLADIAPGHLPVFLTPADRVFISPACSPRGNFIVAAQTADGATATRMRLTLLTSSGHQLGDLSPGGPFADGRPEWTNAGVVFERVPAWEGPTQLWYIANGGTARSAGVSVDPESAHSWDWSASPPSGRSTM